MDASLKFIHRPPSYFGTSIELATPTIMTSDYYFIVGGLTRRPTNFKRLEPAAMSLHFLYIYAFY